jgi:hypothetical protein
MNAIFLTTYMSGTYCNLSFTCSCISYTRIFMYVYMSFRNVSLVTLSQPSRSFVWIYISHFRNSVLQTVLAFSPIVSANSSSSCLTINSLPRSDNPSNFFANSASSSASLSTFHLTLKSFEKFFRRYLLLFYYTPQKIIPSSYLHYQLHKYYGRLKCSPFLNNYPQHLPWPDVLVYMHTYINTYIHVYFLYTYII